MFSTLPSDRATPGTIGKTLRSVVQLSSKFLLGSVLSVVCSLPAAAAPFAYVSLGSNKVAVIDMETNSLVKEITVGTTPLGIAADSSGKWVYVANNFSGEISVINTRTNQVTSTISPLTLSGVPYAVALSPSGNRLYVTSFLGDSMSIVDTSTNLSVAHVPLVKPKVIAVSPNGNLAYVSQSQTNSSFANPITAAAIDLVQNKVVAQVPVNVVPTSNILFSPDGSRAYMGEADQVVVVNTATHAIVGRWTVLTSQSNSFLSGMALSSDGSRLYVVTYNDKKLITFNTATGEELSRFGYDNEPTSLVVNSATQRAILFGDRTGLSVSVNLANGAIIKETSIGGAPKALGSVVSNGAPAQLIDSGAGSGGGGGCGYLSGNGGPPDPTLPFLAMLALLMLASRGRFMRR